MQRIPSSTDVTIKKHDEQEQIMGDHTCPGTDKSHMKETNTDECPSDTNHPHADDVVNKRCFGLSNPLHKAFNDDGIAIERLSNCNHSQNGAS